MVEISVNGKQGNLMLCAWVGALHVYIVLLLTVRGEIMLHDFDSVRSFVSKSLIHSSILSQLSPLWMLLSVSKCTNKRRFTKNYLWKNSVIIKKMFYFKSHCCLSNPVVPSLIKELRNQVKKLFLLNRGTTANLYAVLECNNWIK